MAVIASHKPRQHRGRRQLVLKPTSNWDSLSWSCIAFNNSADYWSKQFLGMKRVTAAEFAVVTVAALLIAGSATRLYYYMSSPATNSLSSSTSLSSTTQSATPPCGYQDSSLQPQGCWARYLGYLPAGYTLAPHCINCPIYPCPSGMSFDQCKQWQASCGNGVCDPNESCATCRIDCGVPGQLTCDLYTERPGIPSGVCQTYSQGGPIGGIG
jgi:hypothetical protein